MLASVMPGLRELRAPLAAGYLWLLCAWLVFGDVLPTRQDVTGSLERFYELEPVISDLGGAVVASLAAYIVGSIVIDLQALVDRFLRWLESRDNTFYASRPALTDAGFRVLDSMLPESSPPSKLERLALQSRIESGPLAEQREEVRKKVADNGMRNDAVDSWVLQYREVTKTRLLDLSEALHSEVDRPDAEATLRMALWPPLSALVAYLALSVSAWWLAALTLPALVAWQWVSLRRQANDALITAIAARAELSTEFIAAIRRSDEERKAASEASTAQRHHEAEGERPGSFVEPDDNAVADVGPPPPTRVPHRPRDA